MLSSLAYFPYNDRFFVTIAWGKSRDGGGAGGGGGGSQFQAST